MARTDTLPHFLTDVADAIRTKTGSADTITASSFDTAIENIPSGADLSEYFNSEVTAGIDHSLGPGWARAIKKVPPLTHTTGSCAYLFANYPGTEIDLTNVDTTDTSSMNMMFYGCMYLTSLDTSNLVSSNVTTMRNMFRNCYALTSLDLSNLTSKSGVNVEYMFNGDGAMHLMHIDMRRFDFTICGSSSSMFGNDAAHGVADNCEIIVADATQKDWINTKFSRLTNVKTVAEYEAEQQNS